MLGLIEPHFQNIVPSGGGGLYAIEALCRFRNLDTLSLGLIRQWERSGYVAKIDLAMLKRVSQCLPNQKGPLDLRLAVNVSVRTIEVAGDEYLSALLLLAPLVRRLIVEVTETYQPSDWRVVTDFAKRINDAGMYVALDDCAPEHMFWDDDFVKVVSPQFLKLDGEILNECFQSRTYEPIQSIVDLGRRVNAQIVAERVDSHRKRDFVSALGIGFMQGWLFNKPTPLTSYSPTPAHLDGVAAIC